MILILSNLDEDAHVPPVAAELERRGEEYRIFNPATYPMRSALTVDNESGEVFAKLAWDDCELELNEVKSVWLRRPGDVELSENLLPEEEKWLRTECHHLVRAMWENLNALWVSEPHHIRRASLKLLQLRLATELGFKVPRFIVTNDVDRAAAFLDSNPRGTIIKVLGAPT
ncbi:MAG: hypothetical protein WCD76_03115, partial [Pyrinomonadaceae bacterium]